MRILNYHPSVEAYVSTDSGYLDLTADITQCTVNRLSDAPSEFTLRVQNPAHKYDNRMSPMDRIVIFASKGEERSRLLTGYIRKVDRYRLYDADLLLSGSDTLYRLQQLYFDPGLMSTVSLFSHSGTFLPGWGGYEQDIYRWLVDVGGWPEGQIDIGALPQHVIDWAKDLYVKQASDVEGSLKVAEEFYNTLMSTGSVQGGNSAMAAGGGVDGGGTINDGTLSSMQQRVIEEARKTPFQGTGWCAMWVSHVFDDILGHYPGGNANDMCDNWCHSTNRSELKPGMIIACHPSGATGNYYGHVGVYIGNNTVRHNSTYVQDSTLDDWINTYGPSGRYGGGHVKWGWMEGVDLSKR